MPVAGWRGRPTPAPRRSHLKASAALEIGGDDLAAGCLRYRLVWSAGSCATRARRTRTPVPSHAAAATVRDDRQAPGRQAYRVAALH